MKYTSLLVYFAFISSTIIAQKIDVDSLCSINYNEDVRKKMGVHYHEDNHFKTRIDAHMFWMVSSGDFELVKKEGRISYRSNNNKPLGREYRGKDLDKLSGWYSFWFSYPFYSLNPSYTEGMNLKIGGGKESTHIDIIGCFDDGAPCCRWEYNISYSKNTKLFVKKWADYDEGLLHGEYVIVAWNLKYSPEVYSGWQMLGDTIYQTTFEDGTGYYRDFYPNGDIWIEGQVKSGNRDGAWIYYVYDKGELSAITVEVFSNGISLGEPKVYWSAMQGDRRIREAIEWERLPKYKKELDDNKNPMLEKDDFFLYRNYKE